MAASAHTHTELKRAAAAATVPHPSHTEQFRGHPSPSIQHGHTARQCSRLPFFSSNIFTSPKIIPLCRQTSHSPCLYHTQPPLTHTQKLALFCSDKSRSGTGHRPIRTAAIDGDTDPINSCAEIKRLAFQSLSSSPSTHSIHHSRTLGNLHHSSTRREGGRGTQNLNARGGSLCAF